MSLWVFLIVSKVLIKHCRGSHAFCINMEWEITPTGPLCNVSKMGAISNGLAMASIAVTYQEERDFRILQWPGFWCILRGLHTK